MFRQVMVALLCVIVAANKEEVYTKNLRTALISIENAPGDEEEQLKTAQHSQLTDPLMEGLFKKKEVKIVLTDWGLGGLSILTPLAQRLAQTPLFSHVKLVFYQAGGTSQANVLEDIGKMHPDLFLIACNSFSVAYAKTEFSKTAPFPVVSMVPFGVDLFAEKLERHPKSVLLLFAADGTIQDGAHQRMLADRGIDAARVVGTGCGPDIGHDGTTLARTIENFGVGDSGTTIHAVTRCMRKAWAQVTKSEFDDVDQVFIGMGCTHYGWAGQLWVDALRSMPAKEHGLQPDFPVEVLDPNGGMVDYLFTAPHDEGIADPDIEVEIVSPYESLSTERLESVAELVDGPVRDALLALRK